MNLDHLFPLILESSVLLFSVWAVFRLLPSIPPNAKAWIWRLAFLKPIVGLLPFAVVALHVLPAPPASPAMPYFPSVPGAVSSLPQPVDVMATPTVDPVLFFWITGVAALLWLGLRGRWRAGQIAIRATPVTNASILPILTNLSLRAGIAEPITLLSSTEVSGPMLVGDFRPVIILPSEALSNSDDARLMIAHEVAHLKRRDLGWFVLIWLVQVLSFFNPIVWLAAHAARQDHESATDELATRLAETPVESYADMLLRASVVTRNNLVPGAIPMAESYRSIRHRIKAMNHFNRRPSPWRKAVVFAVAAVTVGFLPTYRLAQAAVLQQQPAADGIVVEMVDGKPNISFTMVKRDVRLALQELFQAVHKPFAIDMSVQGSVTASATNMGFENVLDNVTRQCNATYVLEKGTYHVKYKAPNYSPPKPLTPAQIAEMERQARIPAMVSVSFQKADLREVLRDLFRQSEKAYMIALDVQGTVSVELKNVELRDALDVVLRQVGAEYKIEKGAFKIAMKARND